MSRTKDQYHDDIGRNSRQTKDQRLGQAAAEEEHYAEQKRHAKNKALNADPQFEGRRKYPANPATDAERFERVCREADAEAKKSGMTIIVFKNSEDNYFTWELKYKPTEITALYTAYAAEDK